MFLFNTKSAKERIKNPFLQSERHSNKIRQVGKIKLVYLPLYAHTNKYKIACNKNEPIPIINNIVLKRYVGALNAGSTMPNI